MRKFLFFMMFFCVGALGAIAQDEIVLADYEDNSSYPDRTGLWSNKIFSKIDNPMMDDVNGSDKVGFLHITTQWSDAVTLNNFNEPISLGMYPIVKIKVLSETSDSKIVNLEVTDINGFSKNINDTLPDNSYATWTDLEFDLSGIALNTPISFISSMTIKFDYGVETDPENTDNIYYFDDIRFTGPELDIDTEADFTLFDEPFQGNIWFMSNTEDPFRYIKTTIDTLRTAVWGGSALMALAKHYNADEWLKITSAIWSDEHGCWAEFLPSSEEEDFSYLNINEIGISGYADINFTYDLRWKTEPASFSDLPTIEYSVDGGNWTEAATSSELPQGTDVWANITHPFTEASGTTLQIRIKNNTDGTCFMDNIKLIGKAAYVSDISIASTDGLYTIDVKGGTKNMVSTVLPAAANQKVFWSVKAGTGKASITSGGVLTAMKNGTVSVIGRALDLWGTVADTVDIVLTNQVYPITAISITGTDTINTDNGTALYEFVVAPKDADTLTYAISLVDSLDNVSTNAYLAPDGTLTALKNGYVIIKAVADDYMGVIGKKTVVLENQEFVPVESIEVIGSTTIDVDGGTLQVSATVLPANADNLNVAWSITNGTGSATITEGGLVTAKTNGTVTVTASALDGSGVTGTLEITITNQGDGIANSQVKNLDIYPNPVQQQLYIKNLENTASVEIMSSLGTVVMTTKAVPNQGLNVQNLKPGLYIIRAVSNDVVYKAVFVKN